MTLTIVLLVAAVALAARYAFRGALRRIAPGAERGYLGATAPRSVTGRPSHLCRESKDE